MQQISLDWLDDKDPAAAGLLLDSIQPLEYLECLSLGRTCWHGHISRLVEVIHGKEHLTHSLAFEGVVWDQNASTH